MLHKPQKEPNLSKQIWWTRAKFKMSPSKNEFHSIQAQFNLNLTFLHVYICNRCTFIPLYVLSTLLEATQYYSFIIYE